MSHTALNRMNAQSPKRILFWLSSSVGVTMIGLGMIFSPIFSGLVLDLLGMESVFYLGGALILSGSIFAALLYKSVIAKDHKFST